MALQASSEAGWPMLEGGPTAKLRDYRIWRATPVLLGQF